MPQYALNFEVEPAAASAVIADLAAKHGWSIRIESSRGVRYRVPSNTLVGTFENFAKAETSKSTLLSAASKTFGRPVRFNKYLLTECAKVQFESDDKKSSAKPASATPAAKPARAASARR